MHALHAYVSKAKPTSRITNLVSFCPECVRIRLGRRIQLVGQLLLCWLGGICDDFEREQFTCV